MPRGEVLESKLLLLDAARDCSQGEAEARESVADEELDESRVRDEDDVFDGGVESESKDIEDLDSSTEAEVGVSESESVTTLMASPSLLEPGMNSVVDPSLRVIWIRDG